MAQRSIAKTKKLIPTNVLGFQCDLQCSDWSLNDWLVLCAWKGLNAIDGWLSRLMKVNVVKGLGENLAVWQWQFNAMFQASLSVTGEMLSDVFTLISASEIGLFVSSATTKAAVQGHPHSLSWCDVSLPVSLSNLVATYTSELILLPAYSSVSGFTSRPLCCHTEYAGVWALIYLRNTTELFVSQGTTPKCKLITVNNPQTLSSTLLYCLYTFYRVYRFFSGHHLSPVAFTEDLPCS